MNHKPVKNEISESGKFERQTNTFCTPFGNGEGELPVEAGRYRIYLSGLCPWCHRQAIVLRMAGLEDTVEVVYTSHSRIDGDWIVDPEVYSFDRKEEYNVTTLYRETDPSYTKRATVPVIYDKKERRVVNNDYFKMSIYWETVWKPLHTKETEDLYPQEDRTEIDRVSDEVFHKVNNGVYKCGFACSQEAYEESYQAMFSYFEELEKHFETADFLVGNHLTDADIRLWVTLIRFDLVYYNLFKCNYKRIADYPNLREYTESLYGLKAFHETTDYDAIKAYFLMSDKLCPTIVPGTPAHLQEMIHRVNP